MKRKTLAVFFQHLPPYPVAGSLRADSFIKAIEASTKFRDYNINLFTTTTGAKRYVGVNVVKLDAPEVENTRGALSRLYGELIIGLSAIKSIFFVRYKPNLLLVSSPSYLAALTLIMCSRLYKIPYIIDVRDIYPQAFAAAGLIERKSLIYKSFDRLSRYIYNNSKLILTATNGLASEIKALNVKPNVVPIYNGYPSSFTRIKSRKHSRFTVCFHGVLGYFQDVETLVAVAHLLKPYKIDVVVIGYGLKEERLINHRLENLFFIGRLSHDDTIAELSKCHLGLCLRNNEGISREAFPVKVWECIGLSIPVIVTPYCEAGYFLENNKCGFQHESGDVNGLVNIIVTLRDTPELFNSLEGNCRKISPRYTREILSLEAVKHIEAAVF